MKLNEALKGTLMKTNILLKALVAVFVLANATLCAQVADPTVPPEVEKALLGEDWSKVVELLAKVDGSTVSPVLRLIKGHACLALNRNNQAIELFASSANDHDRQEWRTWSQMIAEKYPKQAIALYLKGDAFARSKEWKAADECFEKALYLNPQCYLASNARGVVAHAVGNSLQARTY